MGLPRLLLAALLFSAFLIACPRVAIAQPSVTHVEPQAVVPGKTTELTLHGTKLDGPINVWTSFPARVELLPAGASSKDGSQRKCKVSVPVAAALGIGGVAVATGDGLSDAIYLMIDDLPSLADNGQNHSVTDAQSISLPVAIDGQSDGTLADYYRFSAKAGQRVSCEIVAARLGFDFDALLRVLDANENEIVLADDDLAAGADCRFVFTPPADGSYRLEVRDNRYKPGGRYRLRLGDFPLVTAALPPVVQRGTPTEIDFRGPRTDGLEGVKILPVSNALAGHGTFVTAKSPGHHRSSWVALGVSELPVTVAAAQASEPTSIDLPCVASGVLASPRERDVFRFAAKKGVALRFKAITRTIGSPAILSLRLLDASGKQLAESPVTESDEPVLSFSPPADGMYDLAVEELAGRGGGDFCYAVECTIGPQFSLVLKNDKNNRLRYSLASVGAFYLDVQCQRAGYDGPITLAIDCVRPGWQVINNVIASKANETRLYIVPPTDFASGDVADIRVVGRAVASGQQLKAAMTTTVQLRAARPQTPYPPRWHDGTILVSALASPAPLVWFANLSAAIDATRTAGKAKFSVGLESTDARFKEATIVPVGLPTGVSADVKKSGADSVAYDVSLTIPKDLPVGPHVFRCFAYAEIGGQGRGVLSGDLRLNVLADQQAEKP